GRSFPGKGECNVVPAETKGVVESSGLLDVPRLVRHHVEFDLRVELFEIAGGRNDAVVQRQDRHDALHRTSTAHQVAERALRGGDRDAVTQRLADGVGLAHVTDHGGGGVRVDVTDVRRLQLRG